VLYNNLYDSVIYSEIYRISISDPIRILKNHYAVDIAFRSLHWWPRI